MADDHDNDGKAFVNARDAELKARALQAGAQLGQLSAVGFTPNKRMDIGQAMKCARQGFRVARRGWNSKDQYVYYVPAASYPPTTPIAVREFGGQLVPYREYLAIKTAQDDVATWAPSCGDALANDWYVVE